MIKIINFHNSMSVIIPMVVAFICSIHLASATQSIKFGETSIAESVAKTICVQRQTFVRQNQIQLPIKWRPPKAPPSTNGAGDDQELTRSLWYHWHKSCNSKNDEACVSTFTFRNFNDSGSCQQNSKIYEGCPMTPYEFPSLLAFGPEGCLTCGAVLIADQWALTAAHCNPDEDDNTTRVINDLCLVKLRAPFNLTQKVRPARLPSKPYVDGTFTAVGWGRVSGTAGVPDIPRKVDLFAMSAEECRQLTHNESDTYLCASVPGTDKGTGVGDSGGPLYHVRGDVQTVAGITSLGWHKQNYTNNVFTRVYPYLDWIHEVMAMD